MVYFNIVSCDLLLTSNTYGKIENEASQIWKIQYNNLLREYIFRSPSVPPLNVLRILYAFWYTVIENIDENIKYWESTMKSLVNLKHLSKWLAMLNLPLFYIIPYYWYRSIVSFRNKYTNTILMVIFIEITKERIHQYDICRMESWEKQKQRSYLEYIKKLPDQKQSDRFKLDQCLSK